MKNIRDFEIKMDKLIEDAEKFGLRVDQEKMDKVKEHAKKKAEKEGSNLYIDQEGTNCLYIINPITEIQFHEFLTKYNYEGEDIKIPKLNEVTKCVYEIEANMDEYMEYVNFF